MLRSVKYGLYGAVLAGLVGGTVAWTNVDKTVTLVVDGQNSSVRTTAVNVGGVLAERGFHAGAHDILAPASDVSIRDGSKIIYSRGRLLNLNVDGVAKSVWTTAPTVSAALTELGYSTADFSSVSRARRLPLSPTDIAIRSPKIITLVHDGRTEQLRTTDATVGQMLADLSITVGPDDKLSVPVSAALEHNVRIVLQRTRHTTITATAPIPFKITKTEDATLPRGQTQILTVGRNGQARVTYAAVYLDGTLVGKTPIKTVVLTAPTNQVLKVGTQVAPKAAAVSPGSAQAIAKGLAGARGWSGDQFDCLVTLWNHESGWNTHAANPSGAYGIPQALPGAKMHTAGADWQDSATTQITWGLGYIGARYGTPCSAWSSWQSQGGWY